MCSVDLRQATAFDEQKQKHKHYDQRRNFRRTGYLIDLECDFLLHQRDPMHMNEATPLLPNALNINDLYDTT